jgi:hypothetical protein
MGKNNNIACLGIGKYLSPVKVGIGILQAAGQRKYDSRGHSFRHLSFQFIQEHVPSPAFPNLTISHLFLLENKEQPKVNKKSVVLTKYIIKLVDLIFSLPYANRA